LHALPLPTGAPPPGGLLVAQGSTARLWAWPAVLAARIHVEACPPDGAALPTRLRGRPRQQTAAWHHSSWRRSPASCWPPASAGCRSQCRTTWSSRSSTCSWRRGGRRRRGRAPSSERAGATSTGAGHTPLAQRGHPCGGVFLLSRHLQLCLLMLQAARGRDTLGDCNLSLESAGFHRACLGTLAGSWGPWGALPSPAGCAHTACACAPPPPLPPPLCAAPAVRWASRAPSWCALKRTWPGSRNGGRCDCWQRWGAHGRATRLTPHSAQAIQAPCNLQLDVGRGGEPAGWAKADSLGINQTKLMEEVKVMRWRPVCSPVLCKPSTQPLTFSCGGGGVWHQG
jgi:hypothetical protein